MRSVRSWSVACIAAASLALLTRPYPTVALAHLTVACGLGVWICLFEVAQRGVEAADVERQGQLLGPQHVVLVEAAPVGDLRGGR